MDLSDKVNEQTIVPLGNEHSEWCVDSVGDECGLYSAGMVSGVGIVLDSWVDRFDKPME